MPESGVMVFPLHTSRNPETYIADLLHTIRNVSYLEGRFFKGQQCVLVFSSVLHCCNSNDWLVIGMVDGCVGYVKVPNRLSDHRGIFNR